VQFLSENDSLNLVHAVIFGLRKQRIKLYVVTNYISSEVYIAIQYFDVKIQIESLSHFEGGCFPSALKSKIQSDFLG